MSTDELNPYKVINFLKNCDNNEYLLQEEKDYINQNKELITKLEKLNKKDLQTVFSCEKKYNRYPVLINKNLSKNDFHIFRIKIAEIVTNYRRRKLDIKLSNPHVNTLLEDGIVIINDFLDKDSFNLLKQEIDNNFHKNLTFNNTKSKIIENMKKQKLNHVANFIKNEKLNDILYSILAINPEHFYSSKRSKILFQKLEENIKGDIQTQVHSDTFQHTYRWWFYLSDVEEEDGAFCYCKGSNVNNEKRLHFEKTMYQNVLSNMNKLDSESQGGSFRYREYEPEEKLNLEPITVPKNTLILVNTHGFHKRGTIQPGHSRYSLFGYSRLNPFYLN